MQCNFECLPVESRLNIISHTTYSSFPIFDSLEIKNQYIFWNKFIYSCIHKFWPTKCENIYIKKSEEIMGCHKFYIVITNLVSGLYEKKISKKISHNFFGLVDWHAWCLYSWWVRISAYSCIYTRTQAASTINAKLTCYLHPHFFSSSKAMLRNRPIYVLVV